MGGKFAPGRSGNPGGKSKEDKAALEEVRKLARKHTADAIRVLYEIATNEKGDRRARVAAANSLLDRGYGRPTLTADQGVGLVGGHLILDLVGRQRVGEPEKKPRDGDAESDD